MVSIKLRQPFSRRRNVRFRENRLKYFVKWAAFIILHCLIVIAPLYLLCLCIFDIFVRVWWSFFMGFIFWHLMKVLWDFPLFLSRHLMLSFWRMRFMPICCILCNFFIIALCWDLAMRSIVKLKMFLLYEVYFDLWFVFKLFEAVFFKFLE